MTILHGDVRFYNNIFIQQPIREDLEGLTKAWMIDAENTFECGTKPYDGYPKAEDYFKQFDRKSATDYLGKDIYYDHLPVYTGGNVFFNGAQPCEAEESPYVDEEHVVSLELREEDGRYCLKTDLYTYLPEHVRSIISTEMLGEAFEPEQRFENPDGTPIIFNQDYFGAHRGTAPAAGPFEYHGENAVREIWLQQMPESLYRNNHY